MFINIITPCSRPENLEIISKSINIPKENYRWIVVFDAVDIPENIPENCEAYAIKDPNSRSGNAQRNFALNLITDGWIYFNDDDTIVHSNLWENIKDVDADFISFKQSTPSGELRLDGRSVTLNNIDSHNFIMHSSLLGNTRWVLDRYDADGVFANECWLKNRNYKYIDEVLSIYNVLRK